MTDAHCHVPGDAERHFVCDPCDADAVARLGADGSVVLFHGTHPWMADAFSADGLRRALDATPRAGVGEIGLDRLKEREISATMRDVFCAQLAIAAEFARPVALHGAKCWGEVVKAAKPFAGRIPAFLFHGFSRSDGLLPEIAAMNGFISVGPAILNDHAVNYRRLAAKIPSSMLLVETDRTAENAAITPSIRDIAAKLAEIRDIPLDTLAATLDANAMRFVASIM